MDQREVPIRPGLALAIGLLIGGPRFGWRYGGASLAAVVPATFSWS